MKNHAIRLPRIVALMLSTAALAGCQTAPDNKAGVDVLEGQHISQIAADLKTVMAKPEQHDQLLKEWQQLKPAISRMLVIEEELNLMINQLDQLAAGSSASSQTQPLAQPATTTRAQTPDVERENTLPVAVPAVTEANYALQITSLSDPVRLPVLWQQLQKKHPQQMNGMAANYQKISVNNSDYYRLKLGAFTTKQQAIAKCGELKAIGINCLVTNYNSSDFAELETM